MEPIVSRDSAGRLVVERRRTLAQRIMVAVVFLGLACYPLNFFISSIQFYRAEATPAMWRQAAPGFVLMFLGFFVPALATWLLTVRRHYMFIDRQLREITVVKDDRVWSRRRIVPFDRVHHVELASTQGGKGGTTNPVWLVLTDDVRLPVSAGREPATARKTAQAVASELGAPVEDLT